MQIPYFVLWAAITAFNVVILALGTLIQPLIDAMPEIPEISIPSQITTVMGWINWVFPVSTVVQILAFMLLVYLAWFVLSILLRWAKATDS